MSRLFTFGCSFTKYYWPTWADAIADNFSEFQNWGRPGAGNLFISNSVAECNARNDINSTDTVIVMWSGFTRLDYYSDNGWCCVSSSEDFSADIQELITLRGRAIRDLGFIAQTKHMLDALGCTYYFTSMLDLNTSLAPLGYKEFHGKIDQDQTQDVLNVYKKYVDIFLPSAQQILYKNYQDWFSKPKPDGTTSVRSDLHPWPSEHLEIATSLFPQFAVSDSTYKWFYNEQVKLSQFFTNTTNRDGTYKKDLDAADIKKRLTSKIDNSQPERF